MLVGIYEHTPDGLAQAFEVEHVSDNEDHPLWKVLAPVCGEAVTFEAIQWALMRLENVPIEGLVLRRVDRPYNRALYFVEECRGYDVSDTDHVTPTPGYVLVQRAKMKKFPNLFMVNAVGDMRVAIGEGDRVFVDPSATMTHVIDMRLGREEVPVYLVALTDVRGRWNRVPSWSTDVTASGLDGYAEGYEKEAARRSGRGAETKQDR